MFVKDRYNFCFSTNSICVSFGSFQRAQNDAMILDEDWEKTVGDPQQLGMTDSTSSRSRETVTLAS